jgi:aspartate/tyrosine/aromatic aminotransferase
MLQAQVDRRLAAMPVTLSNNDAAGVAASAFSHVSLAPPNAIFLTKDLFKADGDARKINLGVGAYRDNSGKPYVLPVVKAAEKLIEADASLGRWCRRGVNSRQCVCLRHVCVCSSFVRSCSAVLSFQPCAISHQLISVASHYCHITSDHEYLPIGGLNTFVEKAKKLAFGDAADFSKIAGVQTISGTGSLGVGANFLKEYMSQATVHLSNPTWGNHGTIFKAVGMKTTTYRYWDPKGKNLDIDGMLADLNAATAGDVIVLHACAHNPTGVDATPEQWKRIADVIERKALVPYFDCAYQVSESVYVGLENGRTRHQSINSITRLFTNSSIQPLTYRALLPATH